MLAQSGQFVVKWTKSRHLSPHCDKETDETTKVIGGEPCSDIDIIRLHAEEAIVSARYLSQLNKAEFISYTEAKE